MSLMNSSDMRRPDKVIKYKSLNINGINSALEDATPDYMNVLSMIFSLSGLMLKLKWCSWMALFFSTISFGSSRANDDTKQIASSFMLSISAVVMNYLQNPQPMSLPYF